MAVFTMIEANMGAELLLKNPPFILRLYGTFAAPVFILVSGMMTACTSKNKMHNFIYFLKRGLFLMLVASAIDMLIMGVLPLTSVDVLYLIGLSIPLAYIFSKFNLTFELLIVLLIFGATPLLQHLLGYTSYPIPISTKGGLYQYPLFKFVIEKRWIIDGWFPLFPWIGFSLLGVILGKLRIKYGNFKNQLFLFFGIISLIIGSYIWANHPGMLLIRGGYSELFYPPEVGYIIVSIGIILLLFFMVDITAKSVIYKPFTLLGKYSLQIYIFHIALGSILKHIIGAQSLLCFMIIYLLTVIFIVITIKLLERDKINRL